MIISELICEQRSDEWFKARTGRITGSHFQALMPSSKQGMDDWTKTQDDYLMKVASEIMTGQKEEGGFTSKAMQNGVEQEPLGKKYFENYELCEVRECGIYLISDSLGTSPDGDIVESKEAWEIKCPQNNTHAKYLNYPETLYNQYKWQCVGECWGLGYTKGVICSYNPNFAKDRRLVVFRYEPTEKDFLDLQTRMSLAIKRVQKFAMVA